MIWLISRLRRDFPTWDRPIRFAFVIGAVLLLVALVAALTAPQEVRVPVLVGAGALLLVLEVTVLWGNRGMVTAYTRAQRHYLEGEFDQVVALLESIRPKANAQSLTLLGNTYRQLGRLDESEAVLSEAVNKVPNHYFPIYGFGRTLLSEGHYAEAVEAIQRALQLGAPSTVQADLGEAYYRLEDWEAALDALHKADLSEPHRALMSGYLLYRLGSAPPPSAEVLAEGLPYWQAAARRFRTTPYGIALESDIDAMQNQGADMHG